MPVFFVVVSCFCFSFLEVRNAVQTKTVSHLDYLMLNPLVKKKFGLRALFLIETLLLPEVQYHLASSAKSSLCVLLARSTETNICLLKLYMKL